ncbi:three prime repair exonuclease 2 [Gopherus flavomarginatus]|uniref:three prime repair exonuclease 2 n=1 Tax=Gopherus flavomarginatus TaxID=286002 RepID=UPI0021CBE4B9|nr:three prime repair exonuclease 2 [Gopherus flavomarginatus]
MLAPQDFQTFVFFDLETTGLPRDRPRITELSLFALHRRSLLQRPPQDAPAGTPWLPRVLDQLTLCIDPQQPVTPEAARITGLNQQDLEENGKRGLDQAVAQALEGFLARQAPPLCLVAHNGFSYDFPLLRTELARVGVELPPATGCLDTLQAMKKLGLGGEGGYSLGALFRGIFGRDPDGAHSAEGDVRTLIAIFLARAPQLMGWAVGNARDWGDVTPMYLPTTQ